MAQVSERTKWRREIAKKAKLKNKLKHIEDTMFDAGNKCTASFKKSGNNATLRVAVSAYRTSMQAMRDQARYKTTT